MFLRHNLRRLTLIGVILFTLLPECWADVKIMCSPDRIEDLKTRMNQDKNVQNTCDEIIRRVDNSIKNGKQRLNQQELCLAWLLTGKKSYSEKAKELMMAQCNRDKWVSDDMLRREPAWHSEMSTASTACSVATLYDCFKETLSDEERTFIRSKVFELGIDPTLKDWVLDGTRIHSFNSMGHNWWSHCVFNAGTACMAFIDEDPRAQEYIDIIDSIAADWISFSGDRLQNKPKTYDRGAMYESVGYAGVTNGCYLSYRLAWQNTFPEKKAEDIECLREIAQWYMDVNYPRTGHPFSLYFGDSELLNNGLAPVKYLYLLGYGTPDSLWYINQFEQKENVFDLLYPIEMKDVPAVPSIQASTLYETNGWGILRSSWEKNATMLGVISGHTWNHRHADCNSFVLFHNGEYLIKDAGNCSYGNPLYSSYYRQSQAHNVVLFNGEGQPKEQEYAGSMLDGHLQDLIDEGDIRYILADGCGPMAKTLSRNFRHFLWIDNTILVIDDLKAYDGSFGQFEWLLHPEGECRKEGLDLVITNGNASANVRMLFPETLIATGWNHDFPEKMQLRPIEAPIARNEQQMETYYSIMAPEKANRIKGVMAIILKDSPDDKDLPDIQRITGHEYIGLRIKFKGIVTEVYLNERADGRLMHLNSIKEMGGFQTDAYLFAFSYPEGEKPETSNISRYFLAYGSFIRKGGTSIFENQQKVTCVIRP